MNVDCYLIGVKLILSNSFEEACNFYKKNYICENEDYLFEKYGSSKIDKKINVYIINSFSNNIESFIYNHLLSAGYRECIEYNDMDFEKKYPLKCINVSIESVINILIDKIQIPAIISESYNPRLTIFKYRK